MDDKLRTPRGKERNMTKTQMKGKKNAKFMDRKSESGVIYVAHLPWGFEEQGLKDYFSQFGKVTKLRLARSRKTGISKGYAFLKFEHDEVAKIAAETMDNYLMFNKLIKCKQIKEVHPTTFWGPKRSFKPKASEKAILKLNEAKSVQQLNRSKKKACGKFAKRAKMLKELGIEYDVSGIQEMPEITLPSEEQDIKSTEKDNDDSMVDEEESDVDSD